MLFYDYVDDVLERRGPHREAHLGLIRRWKDEGRIAMAGALGDPPHGAAIAFSVDDPDEIEAFVAADPYVAAGLVADRRVEKWAVV
jgi:uncharacterized protein